MLLSPLQLVPNFPTYNLPMKFFSALMLSLSFLLVFSPQSSFGGDPDLKTKMTEAYSEELIAKAEAGDPYAQFSLATCYSAGNGVLKNKKEALKWYRMAAEQGLDQAQYLLGLFYAQGTFGIKSDAESLKWTRKAAEQGHSGAQYDLGNRYYSGIGVFKNMKEAVEWYRKAALGRSAAAGLKLGECYQYGYGVPKDPVEAYAQYSVGKGWKPHDEAKAKIAKTMSPEQIAAGESRAQEIWAFWASEPKVQIKFTKNKDGKWEPSR
jgi:hypothetical protein